MASRVAGNVSKLASPSAIAVETVAVALALMRRHARDTPEIARIRSRAHRAADVIAGTLLGLFAAFLPGLVRRDR